MRWNANFALVPNSMVPGPAPKTRLPRKERLGSQMQKRNYNQRHNYSHLYSNVMHRQPYLKTTTIFKNTTQEGNHKLKQNSKPKYQKSQIPDINNTRHPTHQKPQIPEIQNTNIKTKHNTQTCNTRNPKYQA